MARNFGDIGNCALCMFQGAERKRWSANTPFLAVCYPEYSHVHICAFVNKPSIF